MINSEMIKNLREMTGAGMLDCKKALEANNGDIEASVNWLREKGVSKAAKKQSRIAAEGLASIKINDNKAVILEVNSETDFVAKNENFVKLVDEIADAILNSDVTTMEEALKIVVDGESIDEKIINATAKIGEKLSFRRFARVTKNSDQVFGNYIHKGGKIAVLIVANGNNDVAAKDIAMHAAAMRPSYLKKEEVPSSRIEEEKTILKEQAINEGKPADIAEKMVVGRLQKFYKEVCLLEQEFVKDSSMSVFEYASKNLGEIVEMYRYEVGEGIEKREENFAEEVMNQINK